MIQSKKVKYLVVDSGAFIKNAQIHEYAENVYTYEGAVKEIKDKATLERLQVLPYDLHVKEPMQENYKFVMEFAKKTGDYGSLSATDLMIIALTLQLEKEHVGVDHLNKEPSCKMVKKHPLSGDQISGFYYPKKDTAEDDEEFFSAEENLEKEVYQEAMEEQTGDASVDVHHSVEDENRCSSEESIEDDSDEGTWISPKNIEEVQEKMGALKLEKQDSIVVGCVTTDFAMQNVLLQIGLNVVSVDGLLIKHTRKFILRCFACFKLVSNMTKQFCPNCGNKTLKRVSVSVNDDGSRNVHINFRRPINIRGMKYSLPMPRSGKHSDNPILCEDQPVPQNRPSKRALKKYNVMSPDYEAFTSPFAMNDVYSRAASLGIRTGNRKIQTQKRNPNACSKRSGNKK